MPDSRASQRPPFPTISFGEEVSTNRGRCRCTKGMPHVRAPLRLRRCHPRVFWCQLRTAIQALEPRRTLQAVSGRKVANLWRRYMVPLPADAYPVTANAEFGDGRVEQVHFAADVPVVIDGCQGELAAISADADMPAPMWERAL